MKGISPVIATILLLLITVAIIGIAFNFFTRTTSSTTEEVEKQTQQQIEQFAKQITVDAVTNGSVTIRNTGSATIPGTELNVYVAGNVVTCNPVLGSLGVQQVGTCNFAPPAANECTTGEEIKVTSPANSATQECP